MTITFPDLPSISYATYQNDVQAYVPDLDDGSWSLDRSGLTSQQIEFAIEKKWGKRILVGPYAQNKSWSLALCNHGDSLREFTRVSQALIRDLDRQQSAIFGREQTVLSIGNVPPYKEYRWEIASISGNIITLYYRSGDPDPRALTSFCVVENPAWPAPGEPRQITSTSTFALPNGGMCFVEAPSILADRGGTMAYKCVCSEDLEFDDTFQIHTVGSLAGNWDHRYPHDDMGTIKLKYRIYAEHCKEPWKSVEIRDANSFFVVPKEYVITTPTELEYTIVEKRIHIPVDGQTWFQCFKTIDGTETEINLDSRLKIYHTDEGSGYISKLDLSSGIDLTGITQIRMIVYEESSESHAILGASTNRCRRATADPSKSWGIEEGDSTWVCALRGICSGSSNFKPQCYQYGTASHFQIDNGPTHPYQTQNIAQVISSVPFKEIQTYTGLVHRTLERCGTPSMGSLAGMPHALPGGYHPLKTFGLYSATYPFLQTVDGVNYLQHGLQYLTNYFGDTPAFNDSSSWPEHYCGDLFVKSADIAGENDPYESKAGTMLMNDLRQHPYTLDVTNGEFGKYQRFRISNAMFNGIPAGNGPHNFTDGSVERGNYTFGATTKKTKVSLKPYRFNRQRDNATADETVTSIGIHSAEFSGENEITLFLSHIQNQASTYLGSNQEEFFTKWLQGGACGHPDFLCSKNWANDKCFLGYNDTQIRPGMTATISGEGINPKWITQAHAFYSGSGSKKGSWIDLSNQRLLPIRGYQPIILPDNATFDEGSLVVSRSVLVYGDKLQVLTNVETLDNVVRLDLEKEEYSFQIVQLSPNSYAIHLFFSHEQNTGDDWDEYLWADYSYTLDGVSTDVEANFNLAVGVSGVAWNTLEYSIGSFRAMDNISAVTIVRQNGEEISLSLNEGDEPTKYDTFPVNEYWIESDGPYSKTIKISPIYAGNYLRINAPLEPWSGTEDQFYEERIAPHGTYSLTGPNSAQGCHPRGHKDFACYRDKIVLKDSNNEWKENSSNLVEWFAGRTLTIKRSGVLMHGTEVTIDSINGFNDSSPYVEPCAGEIYLDEIEPGESISIAGTFADRQRWLSKSDYDAMTSSLGKIAKYYPWYPRQSSVQMGWWTASLYHSVPADGHDPGPDLVIQPHGDFGNPVNDIRSQASISYLINTADSSVAAWGHSVNVRIIPSLFDIPNLDSFHFEELVQASVSSIRVGTVSTYRWEGTFSVAGSLGEGFSNTEGNVTTSRQFLDGGFLAKNGTYMQLDVIETRETNSNFNVALAGVSIDQSTGAMHLHPLTTAALSQSNTGAYQFISTMPFFQSYKANQNKYWRFCLFLVPASLVGQELVDVTDLRSALTNLLNTMTSVSPGSRNACSIDPTYDYQVGSWSWSTITWDSMALFNGVLTLGGEMTLHEHNRISPYLPAMTPLE